MMDAVHIVEQRSRAEVRASALLLGAMKHLFRCRNPDAYWIKQRTHNEEWDGYDDLATRHDGFLSIPIGFVRDIVKWCAAEGVPCEHSQYRTMTTPDALQPVSGGKTLDPIQIDAVKTLLSNRIASVELGTGSGKTIVMACAILTYLAMFPRTRFTVLVPRILLLEQTCDEFKQYIGQKASVGKLGDGHRDLRARVLIATPNTASGDRIMDAVDIMEDLRSREVMILDEAHRAAQNTMWTKARENQDPAILWAVSGTLLIKSNKYKEFHTRSLVGAPLLVGVNEVRTVPVIIKVYTDPNPEPLPNYPTRLKNGTPVTIINEDGKPLTGCKWFGREMDGTISETCMRVNARGKTSIVSGIYDADDRYLDPQPSAGSILYHTLYEVGCMAHRVRNQWAVDLIKHLHSSGEKFVVTCRRVWHVHRLVEKAAKEGINLLHLTGKSNQTSTLKKFNSKEYLGLVATQSTISEGVDIPVLGHAIKLDGISDEVSIRQLRGRVCRASEGKKFGYIHLPMDAHHEVLMANAATIVRRLKGTKHTKIVKCSAYDFLIGL